MWTSLVEYQRPDSIAKCLRLLSRGAPNTVPLAGGTWLMSHRDPRVKAVVDLGGLDLAYIKASARRIRLGAMTTLQALTEIPAIGDLADGLLREAAFSSATRPIRNMATLGGTVVVADPKSELCLSLLALDASVVVRSPRERAIPLSEFFADRAASLPPGSILTEIILPRPTSRIGAALSKVSRTAHSQPDVNSAVVLSRVGNACRRARITLGGVTNFPTRLPEVEALINYQKIDEGSLGQVKEAVVDMIRHLPLAEYQREMAGVVVVRAIREAWGRAGEEVKAWISQ